MPSPKAKDIPKIIEILLPELVPVAEQHLLLRLPHHRLSEYHLLDRHVAHDPVIRDAAAGEKADRRRYPAGERRREAPYGTGQHTL